MNVVVTGGAGFIGRWTVKVLLDAGHSVTALDNLSNGSKENIAEFAGRKGFRFVEGDVKRPGDLHGLLDGADACIHLAAQINVQESLDHPARSVEENVLGTFHVLEEARRHDVRLSLVGTCMVYDLAGGEPISETHPVKPASPYAASKLGSEELGVSYYHGYGLPVTVLRPFNTYGPFQKSNSEGGVVSIFVKRNLEGQTLNVYGDGTQTRDLLYAEDCARFLANATFHPKAVGEVFNAGTGRDIAINDLALLIAKDPSRIRHVPHIHPQSEIRRLVCDSRKAERILGWKPQVSLEDGIARTAEWFRSGAASR